MDKINRDTITELISKANQLLTDLDLAQLKTEYTALEEKTLIPNFWQSSDAQIIVQDLSLKKEKIKEIEAIITARENIEGLLELIGEVENKAPVTKTDDKNVSGQNLTTDNLVSEAGELETELAAETHKFRQLLKKLELNQFLNGKYDHCGALVSIHPGQGGTEAMDWAKMLSRMYLRYFERKNWKHTLSSQINGEIAGIKEASYEVSAPYTYGYLKREAGTHRLVRLSPFNADSLRQTSFALVEVLPIIEDSGAVEIKDADLEWNFTRSGGAGGQSVNKTNSAVELTHKPTGIVVKCREERKQSQNKDKALKILRAKLALIEEERHQAEINKEKGAHINASWGNQIRNYVLHPYHLVKDTRTKIETSDTAGVLDGDLDEFVFEEIKL